MRRAVLLVLALFCTGQVIAQPALEIKLVHGTLPEQKTRTQLQSLMAKYDLSRWLFTHEINIESQEIPHSHPVLTLNTRHLNQDDLLLSTFIHEQLHWFLDTHENATAAAVAELRVMYPKIPVGYPDGSNDIEGNYEHMIVISLEYQALKTLLGQPKANEVMVYWSEDHYKWLYKKALVDQALLGALVAKYGLIP
jgi:hypothetical protein